MTHRPIEIAFGVLTLLSVVSVPIPRSGEQKTTVVTGQMPPTYASRVEDLHRTARAQQLEIDSLMRETRGIADSLGGRSLVSSVRVTTPRTHTTIPVASSVAVAKISDTQPQAVGAPPIDAGFPEEEYGCSQ